MVTLKKNKLLLGVAVCHSLLAFDAAAKEIDTNMAQMQAMDKITGKVSLVDVPVNGDVKFGSFSIVVRACKTRPPEETPENFAFVDVVDNYNSKKPVNIFRGWMMSSTPALNPVEHPIYDVWLLKCVNGKVDKSSLLSAEKLKERDLIAKAPSVEEVKEKALAPQKAVEETKEEPAAEVSDTAAEELQALQAKNVSETTPTEAELDAPAVASPEPLIEDEVSDIQEEGAPKSLLTIGNFKAPQSETTPAEEPAALVGEPVSTTETIIEEVVINKNSEDTLKETIAPEIKPEETEAKEDVEKTEPQAPAPLISAEETVSSVEKAPVTENENQLIEFEEVEEEPLDIDIEALKE